MDDPITPDITDLNEQLGIGLLERQVPSEFPQLPSTSVHLIDAQCVAFGK